MKHLFILLLTCISLSAFAQDEIVNDANAEKRDLTESFNAITVSDGVDLYLTQGNDESIAVSASDNKFLERFKTEVENGTLKIYFESKGLTWLHTEKRNLKAYVSLKTLEKLQASSGTSVLIKGVLKLSKLECFVTSGAHFSGEVNIGEMDVNQNSGSTFDITGKADNLKVEVSSGAIFKGYEFAVDFCEAKATSAGSVRIKVNKELAAKANSGGGIRYKGNAVIKDLNVNTGGSVKKA